MKDIFVYKEISIHQAMKTLDKTAEKCLIVIDKNRKLLGTITDGDIRRSILKGISFSKDISKSFNTKPKVVINDSNQNNKAKQLLSKYNLPLIPVINNQNEVVDYIRITINEQKVQREKLLKNIPVVIMAGGKGTRLDPFTKILPKPLIPINEKPIIEHIIDKFVALGSSVFYVTVNYKAKILKAYFEELQPKYKIHFIDEEKPLGTAGSIKLFDKNLSKPFFVSNCDTIINIDYSSLYKFHKKGKYDITLVASSKEYIIQYGTCLLKKDGSLSKINEKPKYEFLINTGLYVLNPDVLKFIPEKEFFHLTHLIERVNNNGKKIGVYPIDDEAWLDVGEWAEYEKTIEKLKKE